jgi:hypothetical protein
MTFCIEAIAKVLQCAQQLDSKHQLTWHDTASASSLGLRLQPEMHVIMLM